LGKNIYKHHSAINPNPVKSHNAFNPCFRETKNDYHLPLKERCFVMFVQSEAVRWCGFRVFNHTEISKPPGLLRQLQSVTLQISRFPCHGLFLIKLPNQTLNKSYKTS